MNKSFRLRFILLLLLTLLLLPARLFGNENENIKEETQTFNSQDFIEFENLNSNKNKNFSQFCQIVEENFVQAAAGKKQSVIFYKYKPKDGETLFTIASRCCINYDTLATLNKLSSSTENIQNKTLLIPSIQGLFISKNNQSSINSILIEKYNNEILTKKNICYIIDNEEFIFLSGLRFDGTTRFYFLDSSLSLPLKKNSYWISSEFGVRKNPFSGNWKNHNGIDLAAEEGTPVYAIKDGKVSLCLQNDETFGNYIILSHDNGKMTSVYAHLQKTLVKNSDNIKKGDIIGYVGQTGKVTGPHLHFEIRKDGKAQNPENVLSL